MHKLAVINQTQTLADFLRNDTVFAAKNITDSKLRMLLTGLAIEIGRAESSIESFINEYNPATSKMFLDEWEDALGIPDEIFPKLTDAAQRTKNILTKLTAMGVSTKAGFEALATTFGYTITVTAGQDAPYFPSIPPELYAGRKKRWTMIVTMDESLRPNGFPYTFPVYFNYGSLTNIIIKLFNKLAPSNVKVLYNYIEEEISESTRYLVASDFPNLTNLFGWRSSEESTPETIHGGLNLQTVSLRAYKSHSQLYHPTSDQITHSVPLSEAEIGDLRIICMTNTNASSAPQSLTIPSGWTEISNNSYVNASGNVRLSIFYRIKQDGDTDTVNVTFSNYTRIISWCNTVLNFDPENIIDVTPPAMTVQSNADINPISPSLITQTPYALVFRVMCADDNDGNDTTMFPDEENYETKMWNETTAPDDGQTLGIAIRSFQDAGEIGTATWTLDAAEEWVTATFAIRSNINTAGYKDGLDHLANTVKCKSTSYDEGCFLQTEEIFVTEKMSVSLKIKSITSLNSYTDLLCIINASETLEFYYGFYLFINYSESKLYLIEATESSFNSLCECSFTNLDTDWVTISFTVDSDNGIIILYLNGVAVDSIEMEIVIPYDAFSILQTWATEDGEVSGTELWIQKGTVWTPTQIENLHNIGSEL